jgi:hypothetical protein
MHAESAGADSMAGMDHGKMAMPQAPGMTMGKTIEGARAR